MNKKILISALIVVINLTVTAQNKINPDAVNPNWEKDIPRVVHPNKQLVELYEKAWKIAATRVRKGPQGIPASPYMDENCYDDEIWIWDGCFMTMFGKYAPKSFPINQTLLNCYIPIYDGIKTPLRIHFRDNPPLFAWAENNMYEFTADKQNADYILNKKQYLQRHFTYFNTVPKGNIDENASPHPISRGIVNDNNGKLIGYTWTTGSSGMDNTPRGRDCGGRSKIMWIDAICQQALSALSISRMNEKFGNSIEAKKWQAIYDTLKNTINARYWNEEDGFYYDVEIETGKPCKVKTIASYWALMAEVANPQQAARMVKILKDEKYFGIKYPFPSLSRDDKDFNATTGDYWRGGIWLPMVYMGTKALEKYGYYTFADSLATNIVNQQLRTYCSVNPHTIWEVYNPNKDEPSTEHERQVRPDFCGWSALGPISLLLENVLGFRRVDALNNIIYWDLKKKNQTHGIRHLQFAKTDTNIIYNHITNKITATTNLPYTLVVNGKKHEIKKGTNIFEAI